MCRAVGDLGRKRLVVSYTVMSMLRKIKDGMGKEEGANGDGDVGLMPASSRRWWGDVIIVGSEISHLRKRSVHPIQKCANVCART